MMKSGAEEAWTTADTDEIEHLVETDRRVEADPVRLRQTFANLFRNASEHGVATSVTIQELPGGTTVRSIDVHGRQIAVDETWSALWFRPKG